MAAIAVPMLLVHGDRDQLVPVTAARAVRRRRPAWHYVELGGVGHLPPLQGPDELAGRILAWLDTLPDATVTELGGEEPGSASERPSSSNPIGRR